ncbi:biotin--[acetyl-CoA-carboxylase] ligase [Clostridium bowmanii]|uniref:biotin--[acetyl-CoA-carboxylase] ligase n=1 Tax=Clostridium bowmanii TaxID=132925 RepID=UPI001C0AB278|nr:biotin--[acetyl-CoA-carboxylase] ligase [Clostridium bowmanii]MBU3189849.1 biotin--[acetyl-CoA-carboxylase] ligase [Clostridium bowmanii]MCA1074333.1 biotin--[acetyl-CoA-carboxylase] ligase [Clostridium bowmanii]
MKGKVLKLLKESGNEFVSGQRISEELGVSRTAIWKYINIIKEDGYEVEAISRKGYRIISSPDILTFEEIKDYLSTEYIGKNLIYCDSIGSTNSKAKELAEGGEQHGTVILSEEQTQGRGRLGRNWVSPKYKGIWMSIILRPNIITENISQITLLGAAAVQKAIMKMGIKTSIKWPNDIVLNSRKVCGILTEMSGEIDHINYLIMGIGINVNLDEKDIPMDLKDVATSLFAESGKHIDRKILIANVLNSFEELYSAFVRNGNIKETIGICRKNSILIGKEIQLINRGKITTVKAIDISDTGELVIENAQGMIEHIVSGEVSIRGIYGYGQ